MAEVWYKCESLAKVEIWVMCSAGLVKEIVFLKYDSYNSVSCFFSRLLYMKYCKW
jgi:hypothetical protein